MGSIGIFDQHKILFPLTADLIGLVSKYFFTHEVMVTWLAGTIKMYSVICKFGHALEQYPKIKFRVRQSVRWLRRIPLLMQ